MDPDAYLAMDEPKRFVDPYYDDEAFTAVLNLQKIPSDWKAQPPWTAKNGHYRLRSHVHDGMTTMVRGHILCADAVVRDILTREEDRGNWMAVPAMGYARHALELALKDILLRAIRLGYPTGKVSNKVALSSHNLEVLSDGVLKLLEDQAAGDTLLVAWRRLDPHLRWFHHHDPQNEWGRYGLNHEGMAMPLEGAVDVSMPLVMATGVFACWYRIDAWLEAMEDNLAEINAVFASERAEYEREMREEYEAQMRAEYAREH